MMPVDKILVGKIVAAQGLGGEIRVQTFTESPDDFRDLKFADHDLKFVRALPNSSVVIMKADGVDNRTAAEKLRGTELFIDRAALPPAGAGEYYIADLIGMAVGENTVAAVHNFGAGDILELDNGDMVSFANAKVDMEKREITITER
ncbi:MAG: ribosome maturation factor RimM [Alphaproteobacteria bacterium]|nr:ribosome maturation factor RimM [Alphaproteobacteria bacterium]